MIATLIRKTEWGVEKEEQLTTENEEIENKKYCVHNKVQSTLTMRAMPQKHGNSMKCLCVSCYRGYTVPTCAALGKRGFVMAGWATGATGRLCIAPAAEAGAMCGIPGLGAM